MIKAAEIYIQNLKRNLIYKQKKRRKVHTDKPLYNGFTCCNKAWQLQQTIKQSFVRRFHCEVNGDQVIWIGLETCFTFLYSTVLINLPAPRFMLSCYGKKLNNYYDKNQKVCWFGLNRILVSSFIINNNNNGYNFPWAQKGSFYIIFFFPSLHFGVGKLYNRNLCELKGCGIFIRL